MRRTIARMTLFALTMVAVMPASAQQANEAEKKKINSIKKSDQYIYSEMTTTDQQTAIDLAEEGLDVEINRWVANQKKFRNATQYVARNTSSSWERITLPRGNMYRAFVYVKKSDILPADNVRTGKNPQTAKVDNITFNSPGGTVEATKAPQPQTMPQQPATNASQELQSKADVMPKAVEDVNYQRVINRLKALSQSSEVGPVVKQLKENGLVSDYGTYKKLADPSEYILIVYNKEGQIEALLSDGINRKNLKNGRSDSVDNYKGRGALGIKVKK